MVISIMNHKSGSGKSTSCLYLGKALADRKLDVLLIDVSSNAGLSKLVGITNAPMNSPTLFQLGEEPNDHIIKVDNVDVLPTKVGIAGFVEPVNPFLMHFTLKYLFEKYDYVLIDMPSVLNNVSINALVASNSVIIPSCFSDRSGRSAENALDTVEIIRRKYNKNLNALGVLPIECQKSSNDAVNDGNLVIPHSGLFNNKIFYNPSLNQYGKHNNSMLSSKGKIKVEDSFTQLASEVMKRALINV